MLLLGARPKGRYTEQHDIFFGIGSAIKDLIPDIKKSWPEAKSGIHIDAWREVTCADGYYIQVKESRLLTMPGDSRKEQNLFFINLGGYKEHEFEEFHYKMLAVADNIDIAKSIAKKTAFYKHTSLAKSATAHRATAHIDDKYGIDVDDMYAVEDILPANVKGKYTIMLLPEAACTEDIIHLGYLPLSDVR